MIIGYKKNIRACSLSFPSANPLYRHNLLMSHNVGTKWKSIVGEGDCNPTQKHTSIAERLGKVLCPPNTTALVLGMGSGSEVIGFARAGINVVAVERDATQFQGATARLTYEATNAKDLMNEAEQERKQLAFLQSCSTRFTTLSMDMIQNTPPSSSSPSQRSPSIGSSGPTCVVCGEGVFEDEEQNACSNNVCNAPKLHADCCECCESCRLPFCSQDHLTLHVCSGSA